MLERNDSHLGEEQIERYSLGEVSEGEAASWEEHLLLCETCRRLVEQSDAYATAMGRAAALLRAESKKPSGFRLPRIVPVLACAALILFAGLLWRPAWFSTQPPVPVAVALTVTRGPALAVTAPAGAPLRIEPDLTGLPPWPSYRLEMVDSVGNSVWTGFYPAGNLTRRMPRGVYYVRVYSLSGELYREYAMRVER